MHFSIPLYLSALTGLAVLKAGDAMGLSLAAKVGWAAALPGCYLVGRRLYGLDR